MKGKIVRKTRRQLQRDVEEMRELTVELLLHVEKLKQEAELSDTITEAEITSLWTSLEAVKSATGLMGVGGRRA